MDLMKYPGEIARMPLNVLRHGAIYGRMVVSETVGIIFQKESSGELARRLAGQHVLDQAEVAIDIAQAGQEADMPSIEFEGQALLAEIVIEAAESKCVPASVTDEMVEKVVDLIHEPSLVPTLSDDEAETFEKIVKTRRKLSPVFSKRQNKI